MKTFNVLVTVAIVFLAYSWTPSVTLYQLTTSARGLKDLLSLPEDEVTRCTVAYEYLVNGTATSDTDTETMHVRNYYQVINRVLAIADIEKMYIPPQLDAKEGLFQNQLLVEAQLAETLKVVPDQKVLDIGCGRGRIAHYVAGLTGAKVSGFNVDRVQVDNAIEYANATGMSDRLDFQQGDHHYRFPFPDESFDASYSVQAVWPFFKKHELDHPAQEIFRVLKPGGIYSCSEYMLTPHFDHDNEEHMRLHALFLPTLAATQSNYPADIVAAFERAGFNVLLSAPSRAPTWPLTDQKTDLFINMRSVVRFFVNLGLVSSWFDLLISNLLRGGVAWADAEKMKIADLNWRITVQKPFNTPAAVASE